MRAKLGLLELEHDGDAQLIKDLLQVNNFIVSLYMPPIYGAAVRIMLPASN